MTWSLDIRTAPLGEWVVTTETRLKDDKKIEVETQDYRHERVWLWTKCGKKILSRWLPPTRFSQKGRWDGLASSEQPIAWHPYFIPADPILSKLDIASTELVEEIIA